MDATATQEEEAAPEENLDAINAEPEVKHMSEVMEEKEVEENDAPVRQKSTREEIAEKFYKEKRGYSPEDEEEVQEEDETEDVAAEAVIEEAEPEMVTVKINGREREVDKDKVDEVGGVKNYQKIIAADETFREVAENRKILDEQVESLRQREQNLIDREQALSDTSRRAAVDVQDNDPPLTGDQAKELREQAKKYREALFEGDEEAADEALANMMTTKQSASIEVQDNSALIESASEKAIQAIEQKRFKQELTEAVGVFNTDYEDIVTDPHLWQLADTESSVVKKEHPTWSPSQILTEAGNRIRDWRDENSKADTVSDDDEADEAVTRKQTEKQKLSNVKTTGVRKPAQSKGNKVISNADYIKQLKKSRGMG